MTPFEHTFFLRYDEPLGAMIRHRYKSMGPPHENRIFLAHRRPAYLVVGIKIAEDDGINLWLSLS